MSIFEEAAWCRGRSSDSLRMPETGRSSGDMKHRLLFFYVDGSLRAAILSHVATATASNQP